MVFRVKREDVAGNSNFLKFLNSATFGLIQYSVLFNMIHPLMIKMFKKNLKNPLELSVVGKNAECV